MPHATLGTRWTVLLLAVASLAGCQDVREAFELREAVEDRLGWSRTEIGLHVTEGRLELTATDPGEGAAAPSRENAEVLARMALARLRSTRRVDSLEISFETSEDSGIVGTREVRTYVFSAGALRPD